MTSTDLTELDRQARKYVDEQLAIMKKHGDNQKLSKRAYGVLVQKIVAVMLAAQQTATRE